MKKLQLFDQNHGLSPLQKCQFCLLLKSMFILSRKACFLTRTSPNTFSGSILHKTKRSQNFILLVKNLFSETSSTKYSSREWEKEREGGGAERKEKEKVKTAVSLLSPKTISKFCFLRMPEFGKVIFCIWIRILRRSTISKRFVRTFKLCIARQRSGNCATSFKTPRFLGNIDRGKWLSFVYSLLSLFMAAILVLTEVTWQSWTLLCNNSFWWNSLVGQHLATLALKEAISRYLVSFFSKKG